MTKYLILSDIHGSELYLEAALTAQKDADVVVICGDMEFEVYDIEEIIRRHMSRSIDIRMVRGNCDAYFTSSSTLLDQISFPVGARHRALVTHGHLYRASYDLMTYAAMEKECDIVIFGHIHRQVDKTENGIRFLNPGALKNRNYMTLTTDSQGNIEVQFYPNLI